MITLILVQILTFIGLALVLRKFLVASSYEEIARLQQLNEENQQKSKELSKKILDAENEHREKIEQADKDVREMKAKARKEIEELKEALIAKGKAEGDSIVAQALNTKKEIRAEIEEELFSKGIEHSCEIFRKVFSSDDQKLVFASLLKEVLEDLKAIDKERLKAIDIGDEKSCTIEVKTSHTLDAEQKNKLKSILSEKLDKTVMVQETVDHDVISGIIIILGSVVIDGSLNERFKKAAAELQ